MVHFADITVGFLPWRTQYTVLESTPVVVLYLKADTAVPIEYNVAVNTLNLSAEGTL